MKSHRKISLTTALLAALVAAIPVSASANSLLSGYGGPGAGNQAILGSALIGGGSAGGGGSSSGGDSAGSSGSAGATGSSSGAGAAGGREATSGGAGGQGLEAGANGGAAGEGVGGKAAGGAAGSRRGDDKASGGVARAYPVRPLDDASKPTPAGSGALGFSAADFGYLLLVLAVLGTTGVVTRRLALASIPAGGAAATGKGPGG
jgi:hypothetical protein